MDIVSIKRFAQTLDRVIQTVVEVHECVGGPDVMAQFLPRHHVAGMLQQPQDLDELPRPRPAKLGLDGRDRRADLLDEGHEAVPELVVEGRGDGRLVRRLGQPERNLAEADLTEADLSYCTMLSAQLGGIDLTRANLTGANMTNSNVPDYKILQAISLSGTTLPDGSIHE